MTDILHDADIREPLFEYLDERFGAIRILEEKTIGRSRADVIMVREDSLTGIEIKSDADTYVRLASQVKNYNLYCDYNYVVIGSSHAMHIEEHVPEWWGILVAEREADGMDFYEYRKAQKNPKLRMKRKITILWRNELAHIQAGHKLPAWKQKSKKFVQEKLLERLDEEVLQKEISSELFERDYTLIEDIIREYKSR